MTRNLGNLIAHLFPNLEGLLCDYPRVNDDGIHHLEKLPQLVWVDFSNPVGISQKSVSFLLELKSKQPSFKIDLRGAVIDTNDYKALKD